MDDFVHIVFVLVLGAKVVQASAMKVYFLIAKCSLSFAKIIISPILVQLVNIKTYANVCGKYVEFIQKTHVGALYDAPTCVRSLHNTDSSSLPTSPFRMRQFHRLYR